METTVTSNTIADILALMRKGTWLVPHFQRDFVWTIPSVRELVHSIVRTRPVGMITLWAQADDSQLPLEIISVPDIANGDIATIKFLAAPETRTNKYFAILDGKQRCTALAMVFAGLRPDNRRSKFAGRFFLDVKVPDGDNPVVFFKDHELERLRLTTDSACFAAGLFPFSSSNPNESISWQWIRYVQELRNRSNYGEGQLPPDQELDRRERLLKQAFDGITNTRFAVLTVPDTYRLDEICEIFDKLNTTGTKVSTVDLIHSWVYADTSRDGSRAPIKLREWMQSLQQRDGAIGWVDPEKRPELAAQFTTAAYVALDQKPAHRAGSGRRIVSSIKAGDLLATPTAHWKAVVENDEIFCQFLQDFQAAVAGAPFPWTACPYPAVATIYFGLRWHFLFEPNPQRGWTVADLNAVFKPFFWRNALATRYDQGFLTQIGNDLDSFRELLDRKRGLTVEQWRAAATQKLQELIPETEFLRPRLEQLLTGGRLAGALLKALTLPLLTRVRWDLLDRTLQIGFPDAADPEIHHIFPLNWCENNQHGELLDLLDPEQAGNDFARSIVNLVPLSRTSNNIWKAKIPGQVIRERNIRFDDVQEICVAAFIDQEAFGYLTAERPDPGAFWNRRAQLMADHLLSLTRF